MLKHTWYQITSFCDW